MNQSLTKSESWFLAPPDT